MENISKQELIH